MGCVYSTPTDAATQRGTAYESSIYGSVESNSGKGIAGAVIWVTSTDSNNSFTATTGKGELCQVGGLGSTTWKVRLVDIPGEKIQRIS